MDREMICKKLLMLIESLNGIPKGYNQEDNKKPLTGDFWKLDAIDLTYLFLETQDCFHIKFDHEDVKDYKFNTIEQIVESIEEKVNLSIR